MVAATVTTGVPYVATKDATENHSQTRNVIEKFGVSDCTSNNKGTVLKTRAEICLSAQNTHILNVPLTNCLQFPIMY
jgi:hypothetical protein